MLQIKNNPAGWGFFLLAVLVITTSLVCNRSQVNQVSLPETGAPAVITLQKADAPFAYEYLDLLPLNPWKGVGDITVKGTDSRTYLTKDGQGTLLYQCSVDMNQKPYLMMRMGDSLPGPVWKIGVSDITPDGSVDKLSPVYTLIKTKEEGEWLLPLQQDKNWSGQMKLMFHLSMTGRKDDWIVFDTMRIVYLAEAMEKPVLLAPLKGIELRDFAVQFIWRQAPNAVDYEIQYSQSPDFKDAPVKTAHPPVYFLADKLWFLPEEEFAVGQWFWHVRGISKTQQPGPWSETGTFNVSANFTPRPPERAVSTENPLLIFFSGDQTTMAANWQSLGKDLQAAAYLRIEALPSEDLRKACEVAEQNRIPILIQVSGPHDFYGPNSSRVALSEVEEMFQKYQMVKGAFICEQACQYNGISSKYVAAYMSRLIKLSAHYGRRVVWADGHWGRYQWLDVCYDANLLSSILTYQDNFTPIWKMNCGATPYSVHGALMGLWLSDTVKNWGVEPENWYWFEAGLHELNQRKWFKEGSTEQMPPAFYGQMLFLGVASGASAYVLEPPSAIWDKPGEFGPTWKNILYPLISLVLTEKVVPDKETVSSLVKQAVVFDRQPAWQRDYDEDLRRFYHECYQPAHTFDVLPKTNNYFLPIFTSVVEDNPLLKDFQKQSGTAAASLLVRKGEVISASSGTAFTVQHHNMNLVMNTDENKTSLQSYNFSLTGNFKSVSGQVATNGYMVIRRVNPTTLKVTLFGRAGQLCGLKLVLSNAQANPPAVSFRNGGKGWRTEFAQDTLTITPENNSAVSDEITISLQ